MRFAPRPGGTLKTLFFLKQNVYQAICNMLSIWRSGLLGATACQIRYPSLFKKNNNKNYKIKAIKVVLELFKLPKQTCNL